MKKYLSLFLVLIALVRCALMDALEKSDVVRFKSLSRRVNELPDISDKYYCIQLASELKEKQETIVPIGAIRLMFVELRPEEGRGDGNGERTLHLSSAQSRQVQTVCS